MIVVRSSQIVTSAPESLHQQIHVTGEQSGTIYVQIRRATDQRTLNIIPITMLAENEVITVAIRSGHGLPDTTFQFTTARVPSKHAISKVEQVQGDVHDGQVQGDVHDGQVQADPLPDGFPPITIIKNNGATPLDLYIAPNSRVSPEKYGRFSMVLDTAGAARAFKKLTYWPFDFKVLPNGRMSISRLQVFSGSTTESKIFVMDTSWNVLDSIEPRNGYLTSAHDHMVLPNGHIVVQAWEDIIMNLSTVVPGGDPAALVVQGIIQELDQDRNVVFQWRTLEHIPITDSYEDLTAKAIRYAHNNAIWVDHDGDFLVSLRHCSSVIRIDRATGDVKWIMGGKRNQFTFSSSVPGVTDALFSYQHDVRRTKSGISLFDNGNARNPQYSRAVEYRVDETNKTAELVWTYRHDPDIFTSLQGCVQTLANGHRVIAWGSAAAEGSPGITEVDSSGSVVFEALLPKELFVYRAQRHAWPPGRYSDSVMKDEVLPLNTYTYADADDTIGITVTYTAFNSTFYNATRGKRYPYAPVSPRFDGIAPNVYPLRITLDQEGINNSTLEVRFNLDILGLPKTSGYEVYHRPQIGNGTFTRQTTQFTPDKRTLVVQGTDFGEFLIADALQPVTTILPPFTVSPVNSEIRRLAESQVLRVAPRGRFDSVQIQVAFESSFTTIVGDWTTREDKVLMTTELDRSGLRYWRTRSFYSGLISDWSETATFDVQAPYLTLDLPLNKFITYVDKSAPILWKTNLSGLGRLDLLVGDEVILIKDSIRLENRGYFWKVPLNTPVGHGFAMRITSYADGIQNESDTIVEVQLTSDVASDVTPKAQIIASPIPATSELTLSGDLMPVVSRILLFSADGTLASSTEGIGLAKQVCSVESLSPGSYQCVLLTSKGFVSIPVLIVR